MNDYRINNDGLGIIMEREGLTLKPKIRLEGGGWFIGFGHNILPGEEWMMNGITKEQAIEILRNDCKDAENKVRKAVKVELNENQFSALVSLAFNIRNFENLGLIRNINDGIRENDPEWRQAYWEQYSKAYDPIKKMKIIYKGLLIRRGKEYKLFVKPV
ncbi:MAG: lysozyme [Actinomycetota bacterium]